MYNNYLNSLKGQIHQLSSRKYRKMRFIVEQVPKSKKSIRPSDEEEFQTNILNFLHRSSRRAYCSPVVLQIDFYSFQDEPPAIHTLAKCYLDLLENNQLLKIDKRKKLAYRNDRQVKALFINYHLEHHEKSEIFVKLDSFSNFCKNLELYYRILKNDFKEKDLSQFLKTFLSERSSPILDKTAIEKYVEFRDDGKEFRDFAGNAVYDSWMSMYRREAQIEFLRKLDLNLESLRLLLQNPEATDDVTQSSLWNSIRSMATQPWFTVELGRIPEVSGESTIFKTYVKNQLTKLVSAMPDLLFPLCSRLSLTILLAQPASGGIDLDNLARKIIPFVNDILKPPSRLITQDEINRVTDHTIRTELQKEYNMRRRIPQFSITRYQIFEVAASSELLPGSVTLYLGDGSDSENLWTQMESLTDKWYEFVTRR